VALIEIYHVGCGVAGTVTSYS